MKLRNKKTGDVGDLLGSCDSAPFIGIMVDYHDGNPVRYEYDSLAKLNEEWEDYEPKEPLIKDEKVHKAVRAWAEANAILGDEKVEASTPTIDCCVLELIYGFTSIDIMINEEITFKNHGRYTIDELCGEEEE